MKSGPDIARIAALIGDPARANMLTALMSGKALTATELAVEAGVTPQTASSHLARLTEGGLLRQQKQGRHKYLSLAGDEVGRLLELLMGVAAGAGHLRSRTGPADPALRHARVCYSHLAGDLGTQLFDALLVQGIIARQGEALRLTEAGRGFAAGFGIDIAALSVGRAPLCRECLDWSERRAHLAGSFGRAILSRIEALGWASRQDDSRALRFSPAGEQAFRAQFALVSA
ncbi:winged helix-turn-helix domain-containing protein [uncultured Paracoccus sp.]|uniref:ArsR/SmtB family transcription factor n=1 Tax=uncultured Paracoccus sp. TaxID=189685 RepID=UPI002621D0D7|nr:winged helix-turn-helix domain-containing protein [uncultured Paracoccus sp.]